MGAVRSSVLTPPLIACILLVPLVCTDVGRALFESAATKYKDPADAPAPQQRKRFGVGLGSEHSPHVIGEWLTPRSGLIDSKVTS